MIIVFLAHRSEEIIIAGRRRIGFMEEAGSR